MAEALQSLCKGQMFLFGALRSGTTVFRLMLDAQPDDLQPNMPDEATETIFQIKTVT